MDTNFRVIPPTKDQNTQKISFLMSIHDIDEI